MEHDTQTQVWVWEVQQASWMTKAAASGFLFHCSVSLPSVSREALREKSVGDRDCIYSAAREYVQLPLPSDSPPPLATAAGLDPAVVGRFKSFCHNKAHCGIECTLKFCIYDGSPTFVVVSFILKICL